MSFQLLSGSKVLGELYSYWQVRGQCISWDYIQLWIYKNSGYNRWQFSFLSCSQRVVSCQQHQHHLGTYFRPQFQTFCIRHSGVRKPRNLCLMSLPGDSDVRRNLGTSIIGSPGLSSQGREYGSVVPLRTSAHSLSCSDIFAYGFHLCGSKMHCRYHICTPGRTEGWI